MTDLVKAPRFLMNSISQYHLEPEFIEWLLIHDQIVTTLSDLGCELTIVAPNERVSPQAGEIFLSKHSAGAGNSTWHIKKAYLPNYVYFDRTGYSGWAELANNVALFAASQEVGNDVAERFFVSLYDETVRANSSKYRQSDSDFLQPHRRFIFLPLQLSYDSVMQLSRVDFYVFYETLRDWAAVRGYDLVVKPHPLAKENPYNKRTDQRTEEIVNDSALHSHVHLTNASIHKVLPLCSAVFCINSGVGIEALIHQKPVYTAGHCDYHWATHVINDSMSLNDIEEPLDSRLHEVELKRFLYYFFRECLIDVRFPERVRARLQVAIASFHG